MHSARRVLRVRTTDRGAPSRARTIAHLRSEREDRSSDGYDQPRSAAHSRSRFRSGLSPRPGRPLPRPGRVLCTRREKSALGLVVSGTRASPTKRVDSLGKAMSSRRAQIGIVIVVMTLSCTALAPPGRRTPAAADTASTILAAMEATYATAFSYEDRGTVTTVFSGTASHTQELSFDTAFVRGWRFRFTYAIETPESLHYSQVSLSTNDLTRRFVIWSDFVHTYTDRSVQNNVSDNGRSLAGAVRAAAGASSLSSRIVPFLLMPSLGALLPGSPSLDGIETESGCTCWRVRSTIGEGDPLTLWIDRSSYLLRKATTSHRFPTFETVTTIEYQPTIDRAVDSAHLQSPDIVGHQPPWIGLVNDGGLTRIKNVVPGTPADRAGLKSGDEIISVDGDRVTRAADIRARIDGRKPGDRVVLVVSRAGATLEVPVTLEERKDPTMILRDLIDKPAPPFDLRVVVGNGPAKLADLKESVVVLDFWAGWCGPCKLLVPNLNELSHKFPSLHVIGISSDDTSVIRQYATDQHVAYTLALDVDAQATGAYLVEALPTTIVIDKTGVVRHVEVGAGDTSTIASVVEKLSP
jgi:thiol-disulfide isomerase/thioredoxin